MSRTKRGNVSVTRMANGRPKPTKTQLEPKVASVDAAATRVASQRYDDVRKNVRRAPTGTITDAARYFEDIDRQ
jgi:hypothetical protein